MTGASRRASQGRRPLKGFRRAEVMEGASFEHEQSRGPETYQTTSGIHSFGPLVRVVPEL